LRATKNTKAPMIITLFENVLNIILNYFFIYILKMGVIGAGIGSAISFTVSGILMFCKYRKNEWLNFDKGMLSSDKNVIKLCLKTAYPVFLTHSVNCMGYVVFAALVSSMGTTVFAAHSIAVSAEQIFYIAGYGFRSATSTMIGISIGERNENKFKSVQKNSILITVIMMFLSGMVLYFTAAPLMDIFTNSANVVSLGAKMLCLVAFSEPFFGLMIVLEGIYYGLGKTKYVFASESVSMWCVRIAFTFLCVKIWRLDLTAVWYCMIADNIFKAFLLSVPFVLKKVNFPDKTHKE
ncbi:MAG: MATE family efflux transporter, partial [Oscillospiraceae bacterium]|nr:MATE family efflux transporter [Oscillospiraceae bacterium]